MGEKPSPLGDDFSSINPKSEYRNPKQIQNPNIPMSQTISDMGNSAHGGLDHWNFGHWDLFRD
jgi:hypothetical protein